MAENASTLADQDGAFTDWIELQNPEATSLNLQGFYLTDDAAVKTKWQFPDTPLNAGGALVVFASGKNRVISGQQLHTNFQLAKVGGYVALVAPDGTTVVSSYTYGAQSEDISFGTARQLVTTSHLTGSAGKTFVPGGAPDPNWAAPSYVPDGSWTNTLAPPGLGYDTTSPPPTPSNIAGSAAVSQSTTNGAFTPNLAVNGILTDFTHTLGTDAAPFWNADFGGSATIHSVTVRNRGDGCCQSRLRDITISILDDTFTPVWTSAVLNPDNTGYTAPAGPATLSVDIVALTGNPVVGRHVRVSRTADPDGSGNGGTPGTVDEQNVLSMSEVEIVGIGASGGLINLARTGSPLPTATQTSDYNATYVASVAINGNTGDFTHTLNTDLTPYWQVNLNRQGVISRVEMYNRGGGCCPERLRDITVRILGTDGATVLHTSPLLNPANALGGPAVLTYDVSANNGGNPVIGQYVRVSRTRDASGGASADDAVVLSLGEVQVMGTELTGYRPYIRTDNQAAMKDVSPTAYWRLPFNIAAPSAMTALDLQMRYDDGFVAYLNGTEVARRNAPTTPDHTSTATANRTLIEGFTAETINLDEHFGLLTTGTNVLAIHGLNSSASDDNFLLQPELIGTATVTTANVYLANPTPGTANNSPWYFDEVADTVFSHKRGFYDAPFNLLITCSTPGADIRYTLDNSEPTTSSPIYTAPLLITNPGGSYSGTRVVRAKAFKENWKATNTDTHTYIFLDYVTQQSKGSLSAAGAVSGVIPAGWPTNAVTNGGQAFNFGFTPGVMTGYSTAQLRQGLIQIPTISVVTQQGNLTDPVTGIYVNGANGHGEVWERPASIEFLDYAKPGATAEAGHGQFSDNIGLRLRGGASRGDNYPKHSFRCFWRKEYGNGKLNYRLYGDEGASEFETFDLRGSQNYSWSNGSTSAEETLVRDPFCRELMGAMGQNWTRSRFAHVYLNGLYWGIFEIHERPENSYGQTYLGGDKDDYDVVKNKDRYSGVAFSTEATDGYLLTNPDGSKAAWKDLWDRCKDVKSNPTNENYFRIQGRNADGTPNATYPVLLDVDNLIDYTLALFYSGDGDACLSGFLGFNQPNNWHGMRDRLGSRGFTFFNHDAEHTLRASSWSGVRAVAASDQTGPFGGSNQTNFTYSNPQWMHEELMSSPEYKLRYADHIRKHLFNDGALTPAQSIARWNARTNTITDAIVPYAGRWATASSVIQTWRNLTGAPGGNNGAGIIDNIPQDFLAMRTNLTDQTNAQNLLRQLKVDGLYPTLDAADFSQHGGPVPGGYSLTLSSPTLPAGAQIYYTTDGTDPRLVRGGPPTPLTYAGLSDATRYFVNTAASGGDNGFTVAPIPPPSPGPISHWTLDNNANDTGSASPANNGTLNNAPAYGPDRNGNPTGAIVLNGSSQSIAIGNPTNLQITGQITLAAWIRPTVTKAGQMNVLNKGHVTSPSNGEMTLRVTNNALEIIGWNGANHGVSVANSATLNTWQHVCGVYDGTTWRLYKNGVEIGSSVDTTGAVPVPTGTANAGWNIGSRGGATTERCFQGSIDDVAIFNRGLSPLEVAALYDPSATAITADWKEPAYSVPASWGTASGGLGYDTDATVSYAPYISTDVQSSMLGTSSSLLTRKNFALTTAQITDTSYLQFNVRYDDGFIAYLNGVKLLERNAPAGSTTSPSGASAATAVRSDQAGIVQEKVDITNAKNLLVNGNNVLAIQALNTTAADNDLLIEAEIVATDSATFAAFQNNVPLTTGAQLYSGPLTMNTSATVQTRVYYNGEWSALTSAFFSVGTVPADATNLVVSEFSYHPADPILPAETAVSTDSDAFEFMEFMNIGTIAIDLSGVYTQGFTFAFGHTVLQPGERTVIVSNEAAFVARYGSSVPIAGTYSGQLSNGGELLVILQPNGTEIRRIDYKDVSPWPTTADGSGFSLVLIAPTSNPNHNLAANWRPSVEVNGTPGSDDVQGFAAWKAANSVTADLGDEDHDGLQNLAEYALGGNPSNPSLLPLPTSMVDLDGHLALTFTHPVGRDDVRYIVETSTDLVAWAQDAVFVGEIHDTNAGTLTTTFRSANPIPAGQRLFMHVAIELR